MAREQAPAFQFYARDWLASGSVAMFSLEERGAYITLLAHCWLMVELPLGGDELAALARVTPAWWAKHGERIMKQFRPTGAGYRNDRLDEERDKQAAYSEQQSGRAAAGWRRRRGNAGAMPGHSSGIDSALLGQCPEDALLLQSASASSKESSSADAEAPECVAAVWQHYAPSARQPHDWTPTRTATVRRVFKKHPDQAWWIDLARRVEASDFLSGRKDGRNGPFKCDLFWVLKPDNLAKLLDGNYDNLDSNGRQSGYHPLTAADLGQSAWTAEAASACLAAEPTGGL